MSTGQSLPMYPVDERRLQHAAGLRRAREQHHGVEQRRVIGGEDHRSSLAQSVERLKVETAGTERLQRGQIRAKSARDGAAPEQVAGTLRQQHA
jgi:hypothetical protein